MPLIKIELQKDLEYIFTNYCKDINEASEQWSIAIDKYVSKIIPISTSTTIAKEVFKTKIEKINLTNGLTQLPIAFDMNALNLVPGMLPTFTAIKPPIMIIFQPVFTAGLLGSSAKECSVLMSEIIDTWYRTGTAVNNASGVTIPWS